MAIHPGSGTAAEFFAGMGLVRAALESPRARRRWTVAYANDIDPAKAAIYRALHPGDDHLDTRDVAEVAPGDIPPCELWTASFPCTDLSLAGGRAGIHAGQSGAVWRVLELLRQTSQTARPRWVFLENVPGLLSSHSGRDFRALVAALNEIGFGVDALRVNAERFTPQSRPRLFLIATRLDDPSAPTPADPLTLEPTEARHAGVIAAMRAAPDLVWHARDLPPLPARGTTIEDIVEPIDADSPRWWSAERVTYFINQAHPNHLAELNKRRDAGAVTHATAFRRVRAIAGVKRSVAELRFDGVAGCLRTPKGGSAKQILVELGLGVMRVRHLTARECMRLQGAGDTIPAGIGEDAMLFALGDAVCVPAVRWALDQIDAGAAATIATDADAPTRSAPASIIADAVA